MQTETKLNIYELFCLTPEEASELLFEELKKKRPDLELIEDILTYTLVDVNVQGKWGYTALMLAAVWGKEKLVEMFLNHPKIDVNLQDEDGMTALILAVSTENEKYIELLLNHPGIDVTLKNHKGFTTWNFANNSIRQKFPKLNPNS
jgi:ankyrin repeat protein